MALARKNSREAIEGSTRGKRSRRSVFSLNVIWQRIALRLFQRFSERLQARIARRMGLGSFLRISPSRFVARVSTRSHQAPVTIISSYIGRDAIVWNGLARFSPVSSIAA